MKKKKWMRPKLIVLVKEKSSETVLLGCKTASSGIVGPWDASLNDCHAFDYNANSCSGCSDQVPGGS